MRTFHIERTLELKRGLDEVFDFFSDPRNLERITPPWLRFQVLSCSDDPIVEGTEIRYRLRIHGIPLGWKSRISSWEAPHRFVDEQLSGPYRRWVHTHTFERRGDRTVVGDRVEYAVLGGALVNRLLVRRDVEEIFDYRTRQLEKLLAAPGVLVKSPGAGPQGASVAVQP